MSVRIAFLGNDPWSVPALEAIAGEPDLELALVVTNEPKPAGRGSALTPTDVATAARKLGVPLAEVSGVRSGHGFQTLVNSRPDVVVVVAYGEILTRDVLELAPYGAVNLHFSLLPRWRGAAPVQHALLAGDALTGVTVMRMDEGLDTGPILNQMEQEIRPEDDAGTLGARLAHIGGMLLVGVLRTLPEGGPPARKQDDRLATLAPKVSVQQRTIEWDQDPEAIARMVRALSPEPGATTTFRGEPLKVFQAGVAHDPVLPKGQPGAILGTDPRGVLVAAAGGSGIRLVEVAPAGRRRMGAADWARGARFSGDERLG